MTDRLVIRVGARSSHLSRAQVQEISNALYPFHPGVSFEPIWVATSGDLDKKTSLRTLDKTNFFTKEIDELLLNGQCRIGIHSAKDLPEPLPAGLTIVALTKGLDPSDSLVMRQGQTLETLPKGAIIATSSDRREEIVKAIRPDLRIVDLRGTIQERLAKIDQGEVDGIVVAECALIRLGLTYLNRFKLPGETAKYQGQLAIVARSDDEEMVKIFRCLDSRRPIANLLYLGLNPDTSLKQRFNVIHYPVIHIEPFPFDKPDIRHMFIHLNSFTHILFTSQSAVSIFFNYLSKYYGDSGILSGKRILAIGQSTAKSLKGHGVTLAAIASEESSEGILKLLDKENLQEANVLWPHSALSRPIIADYFKTHDLTLTECLLYTTHPQKLEPVPSIADVDEIVFTSPSTVDAFLSIYGTFPKNKTLSCIGPITQEYLDNLYTAS